MALAGRSRQVARHLANHTGVMDLLDGMDMDETPQNVVPSATLAAVGTAKNTNIPGGPMETSLHLASAEGNVEAVQSLLDKGVDVNERDSNHATALYMASENGKLEAVKLLIKYG